MARPRKDAEAAPKSADEPAFVQMTRDAEQYPAPHTAQVHPDEVENYRPGGWEIA